MNIKLVDKINQRRKEGTLRSLSRFDGFIDFFSNDYLGLSKVKSDLIHSSKTGSTGSRLISGNSKEAIFCEQSLAEFFNEEAALVFNSGYDANLGFFSCVPLKGDTIIYDEKIHASIRDGLRLSLAKSFSFQHNNLDDLKKKLKLADGTIYVAVESLYSMNGDLAPLKEIASLCELSNAYLVVDEAHAVGIFGKQGKGLVDELDLNESIFARIITFGKAYGLHGAAILCSEDLKSYLLNFARSFIYTTALPPQTYLEIIEKVQSKDICVLRSNLFENLAFFRAQLGRLDIQSHKNSPIQMLQFDDRSLLKEVEQKCIENHIAIKAIYSPTVAKNEECLRINIHAFNTKEEISQLCDLLR